VEDKNVTAPTKNDHSTAIGCGVIVLIFVLGISIGLAIGWWLWPVQWTNTQPKSLQYSLQITYVFLIADSFWLNDDINLARIRLASWNESEINQLFQDAYKTASTQNNLQQLRRLEKLRDAFLKKGTVSPTPLVASTATAPSPIISWLSSYTSDIPEKFVSFGAIYCSSLALTIISAFALRQFVGSVTKR